jgi:uncharacterized protein (TIGR03437 family)
MIRICLALVGLCAVPWSGLAQCTIGSGPATADILTSIVGQYGTGVAEISVGGSCPGNGNANVKFKLASIVPPTDLFVVSPSSGTTPAVVRVGVNPSTVGEESPGGPYTVRLSFTTVDQTPPSTTFNSVAVTLTTPAPPVIQSVVNAASLNPVISPGGMVSILGTNLGPSMSATYDQTGLYPTTLASTTVTFNGTPGGIISMSQGQIAAQAPFEIAGQKTVQVVLTRYAGTSVQQSSNSFSVPETDNSLAVFAAALNGIGQPGILNCGAQGCTLNSLEYPAPAGSIVVLFATSSGILSGAMPDASVGVLGQLVPNFSQVSLTIGGQPAIILYAGNAPYELWGMLQVNATVPSGLASGPQPAVLTIGQISTASQNLTIDVQ